MKQKNKLLNHSQEDQQLLKRCETKIEKGIKNFLAVGEALSTIRENRLYKIKGFETFEEYCQEKWNISRQYASRLILAFRFNGELSTTVDRPVVLSPNLATRFRKLPPDRQNQITDRVASGSDFKTEIKIAEQEKAQDEFQKAKDLANQLRRLLELATDKQRMLKAISALLGWVKKHEESALNNQCEELMKAA